MYCSGDLGCTRNFFDTEFRMFFVLLWTPSSVRNYLKFRGISRNFVSHIWTKSLRTSVIFSWNFVLVYQPRGTLTGSCCPDTFRCSLGPCFANTSRCSIGPCSTGSCYPDTSGRNSGPCFANKFRSSTGYCSLNTFRCSSGLFSVNTARSSKGSCCADTSRCS
jgi:hypothetical protein